MALRVRSCALSDVGIARDNNEDAFLVDEVSGLYLVADGMGGHASGEVASRLCCENVFRVMRTARQSPDFQFPFEIEERRSFEENALANAIKVANAKIFEASAEVAEYRGMGTTCVSVLEDPDRMIVAHVGDSRCYRLRNGKLEQVTRDHSLLNHYIHERGMTYEEASKLTESNVILRAVGLKEYVEVDLTVHPKQVGDLYLLCSDGLNDQVPDDVIEQVLSSCNGDLQAAAERMVQLANGHGGLDNCTVLMVEVVDAPEEGKPAGSRGGVKGGRLGDAPPPPTTTGARRSAAPRPSAAARMAAAARALSTGSGERGVDDDPSWPGTVREEMPGAAGGAGAAGAAPGAAPGGGARPSGGALPSIIIDLEAEDTDSSATMPMSREAVKAALDKVRARDAAAPPPAPGSAAAAAAAAPSPSPSPSPSSAGFMGGAAAPAAGSSSALQAATAAPAPAAAAPPGSVAPEAPGATAAASPPAVGLRAAAPARRTPA
ncbi:MAG TPA: PP2C family serine/threonine-protein phosphatase, partial [Myxococcota bacterium]|nr:PP2C family serine/threonine-protein phosphatase [Myxococcota bacterium]